MKLSEQKKTGGQLINERRKILDKMHLGLSEKEKKRLSVLDDLILQLPTNETPENRKLLDQVKVTLDLLKESSKPTEGNTQAGLAVGLIDTIINSARLLRKMLDESLKTELDKWNKSNTVGNPKLPYLENEKEIQEAFKDMYEDADFKHIFILGVKYSGEKINLD